MFRKFAALLVGGAIIFGSVGVAGTANAQTGLTPAQQQQLTQTINRAIEQANRACAANPRAVLCQYLSRVNQVEVANLVGRINTAVTRGGGVEAVKARLAPAKAKLCANRTAVLSKVPAAYRTQATTALNRLCAT